jgi:predicted ATPase
MLQKVRIQNYKSVDDVTVELGRINVFIGEYGAGEE